jgi:cob(I)alamin adenosyltransferase
LQAFNKREERMAKIYTKTGDKGTTSLIGGKIVSKAHPRLEAYGTVDELIAYIGWIRDMDIPMEDKKLLLFVQDRLMVCAAHLASDNETYDIKKLPKITEDDISKLEKEMDIMDTSLQPLRSFILPGGHPVVSACNIARTVCRRAERCIVNLPEETELSNEVKVFVNRLSDLLFILMRKFSSFFKVEEIQWQPNL